MGAIIVRTGIVMRWDRGFQNNTTCRVWTVEPHQTKILQHSGAFVCVCVLLIHLLCLVWKSSQHYVNVFRSISQRWPNGEVVSFGVVVWISTPLIFFQIQPVIAILTPHLKGDTFYKPIICGIYSLKLGVQPKYFWPFLQTGPNHFGFHNYGDRLCFLACQALAWPWKAHFRARLYESKRFLQVHGLQ